MMNKIPFLAIILGVVLVVIAVVLPSNSDGTEFTRLTKMLPEEVVDFTFFDVGTLQADEDLQYTWESIKDYVGEDIYGENVSKMTGFGIAGSNFDLTLYSGKFDLEEMTSEIEKSSIESFEYEGVTIWTDAYSYSTAVIDEVVFIGSSEDVKMCIDISNGKGASLYDDQDAKDVLGRLHGGYMSSLAVVEEDASFETYGILAVASSVSKQGGNISQISILKFEDVDGGLDKAQEYITLLEEEGMAEEYEIVKDGRYLTITSSSELPGPEEQAYNAVYDDLENAVLMYYYYSEGALPTINGTVNVSGYDTQILDICALLTLEGGVLDAVPEGLASVDGSDNDNCDSGCTGCSADSHYIWAVDDYGIYSTCVGDDCEANGEDGFQGVWP